MNKSSLGGVNETKSKHRRECQLPPRRRHQHRMRLPHAVISFPDGLISIGDRAFEGASPLLARIPKGILIIRIRDVEQRAFLTLVMAVVRTRLALSEVGVYITATIRGRVGSRALIAGGQAVSNV